MTDDDILTLKAAVLFMISKAGGVLDKYRIFKSLYFANKEHLNKYGRLITEDTFYALPYGPVPTKLSDIFKSLEGNSSLKKADQKKFAPIINSITSCKDDAVNYFAAEEQPDMDELSDSDVECLEFGLEKCLGKEFIAIKRESHDSAWEKASNKDKKAIDPIDMADRADENMKAYIVDNMYCC